MEDPEFREYLDGLRKQPNHELHRFAMAFQNSSANQWLASADTPADSVEKFRQMMAEWFRRKHATRAGKIVEAPWSAAGISSPRTELIPQRLFRTLGRICQMHGASFKELLGENGLPFREAGLAQEDCHPRFIACLLRLGDLLDLDDNRFCPVMQRVTGDHRPNLTKAHEDKHAGMRHLRIDPEHIELSAECETVDGYIEAFKWFDWLRQELQDQMANWRDIAPNRSLGLLPTLGPATVRLSGQTQILQEGERPQFSIDGSKAKELLQGANLYSDSFACVRELLQNAVDSTLLNIWITEGKGSEKENWNSPQDETIIKLFSSANIDVKLAEITERTTSNDNKSVWRLTITDRGTGISKSDLAHMLHIGGSYRNSIRQREIKSMPEWMKPSGAFGIGLQSAFMLTDCISFETKSIFTNEILSIKMFSPTGPREGMVLLNVLPFDLSRKSGTTISLEFELDRVSTRWSVSMYETQSFKAQLLESFDPVLDTSFPYEAAALADRVSQFSAHSLIPITTDVDLPGIENNSIILQSSNENDEPWWNFVRSGENIANIRYRPTGLQNDQRELSVYFRGQSFRFQNFSLPHVSVEMDILSGTAGSWLTFSRDNVNPAARPVLREAIISLLEESVRTDMKSGVFTNLDVIEKGKISLFLEAMSIRYSGPWDELARKFEDLWLNLRPDSGKESFEEIFAKETVNIGVLSLSSARNETQNRFDILLDDSRSNELFNIIAKTWLKKQNRHIKAIGPIYDDETQKANELKGHNIIPIRPTVFSYELNRNESELYSDDALAAQLEFCARNVVTNRRYILQVKNEWSTLHINDPLSINANYLFDVNWTSCNYILLPFLFKRTYRAEHAHIEASEEQIKRLATWIQPRLKSARSLYDVQSDYWQLIRHIDQNVMGQRTFNSRWRNARGLPAEN